MLDLTREQFTERLLALHQELDGGRVGSELAEVKTEADVEIMMELAGNNFPPFTAVSEIFCNESPRI